MRIGRTQLDESEAWLLLHVYRQDAVIYFDFAGNLPALDPQPDDLLTLADFGRILALGVELDAGRVSRALIAAVSANWGGVPHQLRLRDADPSIDPQLLDRVTELYTHFRYRYGLGAPLALAILHLRRPYLVPLFTDALFVFYAPLASEIAHEFHSSTPMFWESIRRDLVFNRDEMNRLRVRLTTDPDEYSRALSKLSDVRLHCIIAQQMVDSSGV
ncbi:hypothetical protein [Cryobacterium sp. PH31-L1]|uniref:hypothetical protein n=1 Tax=Cryobacterium sp. PH31-L1 TaxID=3046199 RepID=UPI0024BA8728|nr:hypothetical protein [Cryobacterium sp. PH31-L1]MDJ0378457.1 hypothetical protein [Cryobacterium sp. PH31-L1]